MSFGRFPDCWLPQDSQPPCPPPRWPRFPTPVRPTRRRRIPPLLRKGTLVRTVSRSQATTGNRNQLPRLAPVRSIRGRLPRQWLPACRLMASIRS